MWLSRVLEKLGQHEEAIKLYKQAIETVPYFLTEVRKALAAVYTKMGNCAEAVTVYKDWNRIRFEDAQAHYGLGSSYLLLDREAALKEHAIHQATGHRVDFLATLGEQVDKSPGGVAWDFETAQQLAVFVENFLIEKPCSILCNGKMLHCIYISTCMFQNELS